MAKTNIERISTSQRDDGRKWSAGDKIYNTTTAGYEYYTGSAWTTIMQAWSKETGSWVQSSKHIVFRYENDTTYPSGLSASNTVVFTLAAPATSPSSGSLQTYQFTANWTAPSGVVPNSYTVILYDTDTTTVLSTVTTYSTSYAFTGLTPNKVYYWTVQANTTYGTSSATSQTSATTLQSLYNFLDGLVTGSVTMPLKVLLNAASGNLTNSGSAFTATLTKLGSGTPTYRASAIHLENNAALDYSITFADLAGFVNTNGSTQVTLGGAGGTTPFALIFVAKIDTIDTPTAGNQDNEVVVSLTNASNNDRFEIQAGNNADDRARIVMIQGGGTIYTSAQSSLDFDNTNAIYSLIYTGTDSKWYKNGSSATISGTIAAGGIPIRNAGIGMSSVDGTGGVDTTDFYLNSGRIQAVWLLTGSGLVEQNIIDAHSLFVTSGV